MAVLADVCRIDVPAVLSGSVKAVVAGETAARDVGVIKDRRNPQRAVVAVVAIVAADDMSGRLSFGDGAVVAGSATARHGHVIHVVDRAPG